MLISVITPTFNRRHLLRRLYDSLLMQNFRDFEWIVVDDGSDDGTEYLVEEFNRDDKIHIAYYRQENSGKHAALRHGFQEARGTFVLVVDSDDELKPEALERIAHDVDVHAVGKHEQLQGLCYLSEHRNGDISGDFFPNSPWIADVVQMRYVSGVKGEKMEVFKREKVTAIKWPITTEKFVPEAYLWNLILGQQGRLVFVNTVIAVRDYEPDGLFANFSMLKLRNPNGFFLLYEQLSGRLSEMGFMMRARVATNYLRYSMRLKRKSSLKTGGLSIYVLPAAIVLVWDLMRILLCKLRRTY